MAWPQTRYAQIHPSPQSPEAYRTVHITEIGDPFADKLRTVFVMDDELLRHGLIHVVSQAGAVQLVGELQHSSDLADQLRALRPDLLVVTADRGLPLAQLLTALDPAPTVIAAMDGSDGSAQAVELIKAGANAVVHRRSPSTDLLRAVQRAVEGHAALDPLSAEALIAELRAPGAAAGADSSRILTRREHEVLDLLTEGLDNRTIAARLFIAEATVKFHLHNIMDKFGVNRRAALVSAALRGNPGRYPSTTHSG